MDVQLGLKAGYGVTRKSSTMVERFPGEAVLIMEETPVVEGKKVTRKFTMSVEACTMLGLKGKAYTATEDFAHELLHTAHIANDDKSTTYLLINTTEAAENIRKASFRATQTGGFSNKPLHETLVDNFNLTDGNAEALFTVSAYTIEGMEDNPAVTIALRADNPIGNDDQKELEEVEEVTAE